MVTSPVPLTCVQKTRLSLVASAADGQILVWDFSRNTGPAGHIKHITDGLKISSSRLFSLDTYEPFLDNRS